MLVFKNNKLPNARLLTEGLDTAEINCFIYDSVNESDISVYIVGLEGIARGGYSEQTEGTKVGPCD